MIAIKARYENGSVTWREKPPADGVFNLTVVFETAGSESEADTSPPVSKTRRRKEITDALAAIRKKLRETVSPGVSLANELIAERRLEASRE
jgi:predicted dehydrogenase